MSKPEPADTPVVILAGGFGTRLREVTEKVPKPLVEIGEQPILWHVMKLYGHHGFRRFIICLGYKGSMIKEYFLSYKEQVTDFTVHLAGDHEVTFHNGGIADEDWEVTCAETGLRTGTGGRLGRIEKYIDTDTLCFTYGDGIGAVDLTALLEHHHGHDKIGTVTGVHPTSRYGEMVVDGHEVVEFNEKPTKPSGFVSGGFFVFDRGIFDYVNSDEGLFLEREPLQNLARDGELSVYPHEDYWVGMDTSRDLAELTEQWESGKAPWKLWE